ncbi:hypothetical protein RYZ26_02050 [Terasakiella sp. A23]|uniref:hypothetical protein n=1 Tax=Terasakiella sp. FCG-A23 TaxID=3080561 RepID=UPI002954BD5C|nr:hypothetical protein [Terasakiella sp. A23]MDV7338361.1 hypothetical protein [Terasakiella sp. A23]
MRIFSFCLILLLSACVTAPQYREAGKGEGELKASDVNFKVSGMLYRDPPDCVAVLPAVATDQPEMAKMLSVALARHLGEKVDRVIFPRKRAAIEKRDGLDLSDKGDRRRFSYRTKCRFYARAELYDLGDEFVGVFAEKHVGVRLDLMRFEDDEPMWQAAHTVWRADGGVPSSPLGLLGGFASAARFKGDAEILPSLVDDAMRRMIRTLPPSI